MAKKFEPDGRLARRISDRMMRLFKGAPEVVASEYGAIGVDLQGTTASSVAEKRARRMSSQIKALNQEDYDRSRRARYTDFREIRDEVPEMATALQVLTDFVFGGDSVEGVTIQFDEDADEGAAVAVMTCKR